MSEELERELNEGKIVIGGCCEEIIDPSWQCVECDTVIHKENYKVRG